MKLFNVFKKPFYLFLSVIAMIAIFVLYVYAQVIFIVQNVGVWLENVPLLNLVVVIIFSVLFGITFSYQFFLWRQPRSCSVGKKVSGAGTSSAGTIGLFLVAQCPACASLGALFLPLSAITFIGYFGWLINLVGVGLLLFTLHYLGAFKK